MDSKTSSTASTIIHLPADHTLTLEQRPIPVPSSNQYLIEVQNTTFTAGELDWPEPNSLTDPIPGFDLAGIILKVPGAPPKEGISYFSPGTRVYGLTSFSRHGNARSITVAEHSELSLLPKVISFDVAASIPLSALTAWQALFDHAGLSPQPKSNQEKRVLVTAASGGVGIWVVQLASWAGAHVVGTCSSKNLEFVKKLGADEVVDYTSTNLSDSLMADQAPLFDIVIDCVGGKTLEEAWTLVKERGFITSIALPPDLKKPDQGVKPDVKSLWFIVEPNGKQLDELGRLIVKGTIEPKVDSVWKLENYQGAWERVKRGHVSGKVVLEIQS